MNNDPFGTLSEFRTAHGNFKYHRLEALAQQGLPSVAHLPFSLRILLEAVLRQVNGREITEEHVRELARWRPRNPNPPEVPFLLARGVSHFQIAAPDLSPARVALVGRNGPEFGASAGPNLRGEGGFGSTGAAGTGAPP
mgnify:CR=1 FL=1